MKLTKLEDYSILIISFLAKQESFVSVSDICKNLLLPIPFTRKILNILLNKNIVKTKEGSNGGYMINVDPSELSVYDVMKALGDEILLTECIKDDCSVKEQCSSKEVFNKLNEEIRSKFSDIKIIDFI